MVWPITEARDVKSLAPDGMEKMVEGLFAWLNANLPTDPKKPLMPADVAHVSLMWHEFVQVPGETVWCPHRRVSIRRACGIEFWCSHLKLPELHGGAAPAGLRGRIAWKLTGNTAALFR